MTGAWCINVGGRLYGPYSADRMRSFVSEGRLASSSLIAREGSTDWHQAHDEPEFAELFTPQPADAAPATLARPGPQTSVPAPTTAPATHVPEGGRAHFAVIVDVKSNTSKNLEQAIASLGPAYQLLPNVWIIATEQTANGVRNRLVQELGKADSLFIIDASRGKAAWFNFGPDADVRIRRIWQKAS